MPANGTDQSGLYAQRNSPSDQMRDRSMEQDNSNSGNPQGYIPPTFNPNTGTWNIPLNYSVPRPYGVSLPGGPENIPQGPQFQPQMDPRMYVPQLGPGINPAFGTLPSPMGGLNNLPAPGNAPSGAPTWGTGSGQGTGTMSTMPQMSPAQDSFLPVFNNGSTASTLAKSFLSSSQVPVLPNIGGGYLGRGSTSYTSGSFPQGTLANDSSPLAQQLRHLIVTGSGPMMRIGRKPPGGGVKR